MGSDKAGVGSGISETGKCILKLFRKRLCPEFVRDEDLILLTSPWEEADYRVGIYLYDIQDHSVMTTAEIPVSDTLRRFPPKAVELSYLASEEQKDFLSAMDYAQAAPSLSQAQRIKKLAQEGECTLDAMCEIMNEIKKGELDRVTFKTDSLRKYFPKSYTNKQMEDKIIQLLEQWQKKREKSMER